MWLNKTILLIIVSFLINDLAFSQGDTVKKDTALLYSKIEDYSQKNRLNRLVYSLFFRPVRPVSKTEEVKKINLQKVLQKQYNSFEGKIIRNIDIYTLDPFGYSAIDTNQTRKNFFHKAGNWLHISTRPFTIHNLLLFRKNQPFNTLIVKESERLIRLQKYVHDVSFTVVPAGINFDSVDIVVRELDNWSITPAGSLSSKHIEIGLTDKNFLGLGHEFRNTYSERIIYGTHLFNTYYSIPNFRNTYISLLLHAGTDGQRHFNRILAIERPFYSPLTRWAGGVSFVSQNRIDSLKDINQAYVPITLDYKIQDYWAGVAIPIFKGNNRRGGITNLITSIRFLNTHYDEKPAENIDHLNIYGNERFYLASIGISSRQYIQDTYIFKYGIIEDVPDGKVYELTGGYQVKEDTGRIYLGARYSYGTFYNWGYLSTNIGFGSFFHNSSAEQSVLTAGLNYFTGLFEIGRWKFRQFVKPQIDLGINRVAYDSLTLNDGYGLEGFNSTDLSGTRRLLLTMQTQSYAPWSIIGFHLGPFVNCSLGMVGDAANGFKHSKIYSQIGLGILIRNENLIFNSFQISVSFYPTIPGIGQNLFKMNSFRSTDFGFRDFETGKPSPIIYR